MPHLQLSLRYFTGAIAHSAPELLKLSPERALPAGIEICCEEQAARKETWRAAAEEFELFTCADAGIVPGCDRRAENMTPPLRGQGKDVLVQGA